MHQLGTHWIIDTEEEFKYKCSFAFKTLKYVDELINQYKVHWWFYKCYANWEDEIHFVIFTSYISEEYKDYLLSLKVIKNQDGKYDISIQKKTP